MHRSFVSQKQHGKCQGKCGLFLRIQKKNHNKAVAVPNEREATCYSSAYFIYRSYASRPTFKGSQGQLVDSW